MLDFRECDGPTIPSCMLTPTPILTPPPLHHHLVGPRPRFYCRLSLGTARPLSIEAFDAKTPSILCNFRWRSRVDIPRPFSLLASYDTRPSAPPGHATGDKVLPSKPVREVAFVCDGEAAPADADLFLMNRHGHTQGVPLGTNNIIDTARLDSPNGIHTRC